MRSSHREFGSDGAGKSLVGYRLSVHHHLSVKEWIRRLGWWGLWLVAQRGMRLWLADGESRKFSNRQDRHVSC